MAADGRRTASDGREAAFGDRSADCQRRRKKKAFVRGGHVWPPRSDAKDGRSREWRGSGGQRIPSPSQNFSKKRQIKKNVYSVYIFSTYLFPHNFLVALTYDL